MEMKMGHDGMGILAERVCSNKLDVERPTKMAKRSQSPQIDYKHDIARQTCQNQTLLTRQSSTTLSNLSLSQCQRTCHHPFFYLRNNLLRLLNHLFDHLLDNRLIGRRQPLHLLGKERRDWVLGQPQLTPLVGNLVLQLLTP